MHSHASILLIDDSPGECELFRLALAQIGIEAALYTEHDAEAALHFLTNQCLNLEGGLYRSQRARVERTPPTISPSDNSGVSRSASTRDRSGPPSLILLDWNLRNQHGDQFLKRLRADSRFATIPVVVFTTSDDASDLLNGYVHGANGYVVKPGTFDELVRCVTDLCGYWLRWNRTPVTAESRC